MIGRLNHVAIAVPDLEEATELYRMVLGAEVSEPVPLPEHGVTTVFVNLPNTKIELLHPLGDQSPICRFLEKNTSGGIHHICYEVDDIEEAPRAIEDERNSYSRRWRTQNWSTRKAGFVSTPERFRRHSD